ncbi:TIGR04282 family arsenosugar biosynthesis glycosyltransferase [Gelidibacter salicanalis]|uniref:TIGR04282 family arsenosugar biosynthesis glycosyltransferase n=1 Tax=Gelidibacter salicanalis TaxID=291193 RepID=A0A934NHF9_9FLAO|nr:TIGR04282 family arsenosugar biosynthesis glycosyltransferase [Gelidibacter salicanalis]MBJ7880801.1 TIGR04282 family arsenosugar biosynthesis glycosyltransferase [Gelidibacter salicanalis]
MGILSSKDTAYANEMATDFHFPSSKQALIIFTRNPELGKCKTRLAATIGDANALEVYKLLLNHTATISKEIKADRYVFYSENIQKEDLWNASLFRKKLQHGNDLGARMHNAFSELLNMGYEKVIIIGSDLLDLNADHVNEAFDQLDGHDVVIGPALDGGYYLLGMKSLHPNVFRNKAWGTDTVLKDTLQDLQSSKFHLLKELNDIDTFEDMQQYPQLKKFHNTL